jgi:platelet-activating factor acetylhydrolase
MTLRSLQLDIRVHELYETYRSFNTLITSGASALPPGLAITADTTRYKGPEAREWLGKMFDKGSVDTDEVDLVGHSFGGGTLIWALERGVPEGETALPVRKAVALDPW